jgi:hypothetical protein
MRDKTQLAFLLAAIAALLFAIASIYNAKLAAAPTNFEGHIAIEGGPTANPPLAP